MAIESCCFSRPTACFNFWFSIFFYLRECISQFYSVTTSAAPTTECVKPRCLSVCPLENPYHFTAIEAITMHCCSFVGGPSPSCWERSSLLSISGQGRGNACSTGRKQHEPEAQRADSGGGVLRKGESSPLPTSWGACGNAASSPSGVRGVAPASNRFFLYSRGTTRPLLKLVEANFWGGMAPLPPLLNPPMCSFVAGSNTWRSRRNSSCSLRSVVAIPTTKACRHQDVSRTAPHGMPRISQRQFKFFCGLSI